MRKITVNLTDSVDPTIGTPTGSLISNTVTDRLRSLAYTASDQGGGVYIHRLFVDGLLRFTDVVNPNGGKCALPFRDPVPCRTTSVNGNLTYDTQALADGTHSVVLDVRDATDVNKAQTAPWTIVVDNQPPQVGAVTVTGTAREGDTLTCSAPANGQTPTTTYEWVRAGADGSGAVTIPGASASTYTPGGDDAGKKLLCRISVTDHGGTTIRESTLTGGPFADGGTVAPYCGGRPTGPTDECGDFDADQSPNRLDADDDNDGTNDEFDPAPFDASLPAKVGPGPAGPAGPAGAPGTAGSTNNTSTSNTSSTTTSPVTGAGPTLGAGGSGGAGGTTLVTSDLNTIGNLRNPISETIGNGEPVSGDALLAIKFAVGRGTAVRTAARVVAGYRQGLRIRGTLQTGAGRAISAARVYLVQKALGAADTEWRLDGTAVTGADGSFALPVRAGGRSRDLRVVYFPRGGSNANRGSNPLSLRVRQDATLSVSRRQLRNGGRLNFSGVVLGSVPSSGVDVRIQVRLNRSWFTFAKLTTTRSKGGRFQAAHRFTKTTRPTTYRFRVLVLPRNRTTYVTGFSRHLDVRVLP